MQALMVYYLAASCLPPSLSFKSLFPSCEVLVPYGTSLLHSLLVPSQELDSLLVLYHRHHLSRLCYIRVVIRSLHYSYRSSSSNEEKYTQSQTYDGVEFLCRYPSPT